MPELIEKNYIPSHEDIFVGGLKGKQALLNNCGVLLSSAPVRSLTVTSLPDKVRKFVEESAKLCCPANIHICDGSEKENQMLLQKLQENKTIVPLPKYKNCWLARTDPKDVARVESKTFISTQHKRDARPETKKGVEGRLTNWMSLDESENAISERFPNSMKDRTMYVIPFSMGPVGGALSKIGIQVTDSPYVVVSMRIMTRIGTEVLEQISYAQESGSAECNLVTAMHSVGRHENQLPHWPCDPERTLILHMPDENKIVSYGSGYGGNSLLGKKCFALRIGSTIAKKEGWLAEHMLILGITPPNGQKKYIAAAFPSACGKTNLAMMLPSLPGYKIECVGDDIAWIRFNKKTGMFHAINPEAGIFGVAPGTSSKTNPNAMATISANTMFTNVAMTSDGGVWWEGLPTPDVGVSITDWLGRPWTPSSKTNAAHPNSRFCAPMSQCPIVDSQWENSEGVPLSAILFGGRRPAGVPLVYESFDWSHGVFIGASMRSEATAAAEFKGKVIMNDPFAMRPFFGYNFGLYLEHWLSMENIPGIKLPKIFHVNWFRKNKQGQFMWPGFGENIRVMDWILKRIDGDSSIVTKSAIGYVPNEDAIKIDDLSVKPDMKELLSAPKDFWLEEVESIRQYFEDQIPYDIPKKISEELIALKTRLHKQN